MGFETNLMSLARSAKHKAAGLFYQPVYLSPVRRVGHVASRRRVCAMTFDDGPCLLPPSEQPGGDPLTLGLIRTLEEFHARGTFDVIGDTSGNYPDRAGRPGTAAWGGIRYDHYPDIGRDAEGGAAHGGALVRRMLEGGHALANHGYAHILFGRKSLVYGRRAFLPNIGAALSDLTRLHTLVRDEFGYEMTLSRPPHYVDALPDGFTSYDVYAVMGYTYLAADFDGGGWMPLDSYRAEVEAMVRPMERLLSERPDALCGQIIFQKDGFNMARRTPVADGLPLQLDLLKRHGYEVLTVPELLALSPFSDLYEDHPAFSAACALLRSGMCVAYRDNTVRPEEPCTRGEFCMMVHGRRAVLDRADLRLPLLRREHPYSRAAWLAEEPDPSPGGLELPLDSNTLDAFCRTRYGKSSGLSGRFGKTIPRGEVLLALAELEETGSGA